MNSLAAVFHMPGEPPAQSAGTGKRIAFWGDSITHAFSSRWQPALLSRLGLTKSLQDACGGRRTGSALEDYGGQAQGTNIGTYPCRYTKPAINTGKPGNTLAQDLADTDILMIWLGTNDFSVPLGGHGDPTSAGTEYGNIRALLEAMHAANPRMRIVWVTPYNSQRRFPEAARMQRVVSAIKDVCADYDVPVLDLYNDGPISQSNWDSFLVDGLHPSPAGGAALAAQIAEFIETVLTTKRPAGSPGNVE